MEWNPESMFDRVLKAIERFDEPPSDGSHTQSYSPPNWRRDRNLAMTSAVIEAIREKPR